MGGNHHSAARGRHSHGNSGHHHSGGDHDHNGHHHAKHHHIKPGGNTGGSSHGYSSHHGGAQPQGHVKPVVKPKTSPVGPKPTTKSTGQGPHSLQKTAPVQQVPTVSKRKQHYRGIVHIKPINTAIKRPNWPHIGGTSLPHIDPYSSSNVAPNTVFSAPRPQPQQEQVNPVIHFFNTIGQGIASFLHLP